MLKLFAGSLVISSLLTGVAMAADGVDLGLRSLPAPESSQNEFFGHVYTAGNAQQFASDGLWRGYSTFGGRVAYDPADHGIGFQGDGKWDYSFSPSQIYRAQATGHVTKTISDETKIGAFVGYDKFQRASLGFEALTTLSPTLWVQGQMAVIDATPSSTIGFGAGGSVHQSLGSNFNLRGDLMYLNYTSINVSAYGVAVGGQYTLSSMPLSIGLSGGYNYYNFAGTTDSEILITSKLQYSFGGPAEGVRGKLFRTNVLGLTP